MLVMTGALMPGIADAQTDQASTYRGEYTNAFMAGRTADGRRLTVMAGTHALFPYDDAASTYDQVAVRLDGQEPLVLTGRPHLTGLEIELGEEEARFAFTHPKLELRLTLRAVRHESRYEGDPGQLGDLFIGFGYEPDDSPGLVYTPYELTRIERASLTLRGRRMTLSALHGQAETGTLDVPTDPRFRSAYDYAAAPTLGAGAGSYTYVGFDTHALHSGSDGALDQYFRETGSDEMTMQDGSLSEGNQHGVPAPFANRGPLPAGSRKLAQWAVDLGPGILYRKLVRLRDAHRRAVEVLSETIVEDPGAGPDDVPPRITRARLRARRISLRLSEPALVGMRVGGRWRLLGDGRPGRNVFRGRWRDGVLGATDEAGNRSNRVGVKAR